MTTYVLRRFLELIPVFLGATLLVYFLVFNQAAGQEPNDVINDQGAVGYFPVPVRTQRRVPPALGKLGGMELIQGRNPVLRHECLAPVEHLAQSRFPVLHQELNPAVSGKP
ncbi:hypothetical protein G9E11_15340 [Arthrobacter sp. IA7]|uniref:hypothetical protein n=1 Tax=Arthrobacter ipis TaxID=2716202 RepID=UPI0016842FCC|nr:hypothetical protein [Arthrobacter ipis]MBD1543585.1 hypothetical protein [Arthrobacter ipis]